MQISATEKVGTLLFHKGLFTASIDLEILMLGGLVKCMMQECFLIEAFTRKELMEHYFQKVRLGI